VLHTNDLQEALTQLAEHQALPDEPTATYQIWDTVNRRHIHGPNDVEPPHYPDPEPIVVQPAPVTEDTSG